MKHCKKVDCESRAVFKTFKEQKNKQEDIQLCSKRTCWTNCQRFLKIWAQNGLCF